MLDTWLMSITEANMVTILLLAIVLISLLQGWRKGASRSAGRLFALLGDAVLAIVALALSIPFTLFISTRVKEWLSGIASQVPNREISLWEQIYYTFMTSMADFPLMRFAVLFILSYAIIQLLLKILVSLLFGGFRGRGMAEGERSSSLLGRLMGAGIGTVIGTVRCIVVIAILFIYVTLQPDSSFSRYVEASPVYQDGARKVIEPISGNLVKDKLPVFTKAVEKEMAGILQRKYEIIDSAVSDDIVLAAGQIVEGAQSDEEKARRLYDWVGTRVTYDYDKVDDYEQRGIWREQTPQDTFDTRLGVCIDYARLYAVMARSQGLDVRVVTGLGYNGQGGYGPHAWNEVYLSNEDKWIPLDPTWAQSGNWFNPPRFAETHIKDSYL